jgi:hypothetical protein
MRRRLETRSRAGAVILELSRFDREHRFTARTTVHRAALLLCCKKRSRGRLMDLIQFQKICPIPHLSDDYSLVARSVANDHSLLFLFVERAGESAVTSTFQSGIGTFPRTKNGRSKTVLPAEATSGSLETIEFAQTRRNLSLGRHIPRRKPRCSWRSENDYDLNGTVLDPRSGRSTRILLGDGIDRARTDKLGRIRVSYFDEGILGNFGWGPPGPAPWLGWPTVLLRYR